MAGKRIRIGVDIGGTFTDLQILDEATGAIAPFKLPTTPEDPSIGLMDGIKGAAAKYGFALAEVGYVLHGTTIATNAVLERKLARGALVTTEGFEDVLEIGRHSRKDIYSVWPQPAPVLIERDRRLGFRERMRATGAAETAPTEAGAQAVIDRLRGMEVDSVAVCLLHAYANPAHEEYLGERIARALPGLALSLSSQISPEIREYERTSTTVLNALLQPVVRAYMGRLARRMEDERFAPRLLIVQSNGGVCSPETAAREPARLLLSGPSGGAMAALDLSRTLGEHNIIGVDMGGTSFDVSVVRDDRIEVVTQGEIDRLPVRMPMVEIRTIGAGGGSIARVGAGGQMTVGPESAGARPGPVCYGRGGQEPTVTDANLLLGRLDAQYFLGGAMALDLDGACRAVATKIAAPLGIDADAAAAGILRIANTSLAAAVRLSLFEKGLDPRDFTLLSFGGAGSIHACAVADELGIRRIVFPVDASTFSASGILMADIEHAFARSGVRPFDATALRSLQDMAAALRAQANDRLAEDGVAPGDRRLELLIDLRYKGQAFELTVPWPEATVDEAALAAVAERFHRQHERRFSYANRADRVEMVTLRLNAIGRLARPETKPDVAPPDGAPQGARDVYLDGTRRSVPVWRRPAIGAVTRIAGPAIVEEDYTTLLVAPGWTLRRVAQGHLMATREGET
ncbi:MAG: hydantoinase/oxoprolinase family protein [Rhodospirillales bacterium]|nr:hydantoinase/oxoprolinase family protein [Rhodospirillales bacterium]